MFRIFFETDGFSIHAESVSLNPMSGHYNGYLTLYYTWYEAGQTHYRQIDRVNLPSWDGYTMVLQYTDIFSGTGEGPKIKTIHITTK